VEVLGATTVVMVPDGGAESALAGLASYYVSATPDARRSIDRALDAAGATLSDARRSDNDESHRRLRRRTAEEKASGRGLLGGPLSEAVAMAVAPFVGEKGLSSARLFGAGA
jgi:hypothetical protein